MNIKKYCEELKIDLFELSEITGISYAQICLIAKTGGNPRKNTIQRIYETTKKKFGVGLNISGI